MLVFNVISASKSLKKHESWDIQRQSKALVIIFISKIFVNAMISAAEFTSNKMAEKR